MVRECRLLGISRSSYYYEPVPETDETLALMTVIDETFMECPCTAVGRWLGTCGALATRLGDDEHGG